MSLIILVVSLVIIQIHSIIWHNWSIRRIDPSNLIYLKMRHSLFLLSLSSSRHSSVRCSKIILIQSFSFGSMFKRRRRRVRLSIIEFWRSYPMLLRRPIWNLFYNYKWILLRMLTTFAFGNFINLILNCRCPSVTTSSFTTRVFLTNKQFLFPAKFFTRYLVISFACWRFASIGVRFKCTTI